MSFFDQRWKIRIGDVDHGSVRDDANAKDLDILDTFVHPNYNGVAAYFDVAVLETEPLVFSKSIRPGVDPTKLFFLHFPIFALKLECLQHLKQMYLV